jgi:integrase
MAGFKIESRDGIWYITGTFKGKRVRKSLGTRDKQTAEEIRIQYEADLWKRHTYGEEAIRTFEEAALDFMEQGGERRFLPRIIKHFKGRAVGSIKPGEVRQMALALYPTAAPRTRNRQAIAPARAVINHAHDLGWCGQIKVKQFETTKSVKHKPVDRKWLDKFMAEADRRKLPHLSALVLFMNQTGTRVSEAIRVLGMHVDLAERIVVLERTKTEEWVSRHLTTELVLRISALGAKPKDRVFSYTDPKAVTRRMKAVCVKAGIEVRTTHSAGRHSFGTNAMNAGARVKDVMEAGGWKSARLFMETYVHSTEGGKNVAAIFDRQTGPIDTELAQPAKTTRRRFGNQKVK